MNYSKLITDCQNSIEIRMSWSDDFDEGLSQNSLGLLYLNYGADISSLEEINKKDSIDVLKNLLRYDLCYQNIERMKQNLVEKYTEEIFEEYDDVPVKFYTNIQVEKWKKDKENGILSYSSSMSGWGPFDAGIIFLTPKTVSCIWVSSED